jgi:hypothetical protein
MRALDSNSKKQSSSAVFPVPKTAKGDGPGVDGSRPHDVLRSRDSLSVTHPGDKHEREADKAADTVMSNRPVSPNSDHAAQNSSSLPSTRAVAASGAPLQPNTRALMETRFGHDFSQVRVHTDDKAAASARDANARAYTVGDDIVFGKGQYHPSAASSQRLIAHELAHVVQQRQTGRQAVARQLEYEEIGRVVSRKDVEDIVGLSYWEYKVTDAYALSYETDRLHKDPEEKDAVLSVLWAKQPPGQLTTAQVVEVEIPARTPAIGKPLLYRFLFQPKDPAVANSKPRVTIKFAGEGSAAKAISPSKPPNDFSSRLLSFASKQFPGGSHEAYFKNNPEEKKYLLHWIEKQAPVKFAQQVKIKTSNPKNKITTTKETTFLVEGEKNKNGDVTKLLVTYLGAFQPDIERAPTDYRSKGYADLMVERAQTTPDDLVKDKLGQVNLPAGISSDEAVAVKYYIVQYFGSYTRGTSSTKFAGTRNAEVDAIVVVPNKPTKVLYTFRFRANNDVDVEKVGEMGAGASQKDPGKLDIARAPEYVDKAQDPKTFAKWLKGRYPTVPVVGTTVEDMRTNFNTEAEAKADKPEWFKNYEIKVLNAADAKTRLKTIHKYKEQQVADLKEFLPAELRVLEVTLETMSRKVLDVMKNVRMIRQKVSIALQPDKSFAEEPIGGRAIAIGGNKTVIIFDSGARTGEDPTQFLGGGTSGVLPEKAGLYAHELGHLVGTSAVQKKFDAFIAKHSIKPFTKYAKEKVAVGKPNEFFAEAFQLYQTDPEWMLTNYPLLHAWFDTLAKTGKPPVK